MRVSRWKRQARNGTSFLICNIIVDKKSAFSSVSLMLLDVWLCNDDTVTMPLSRVTSQPLRLREPQAPVAAISVASIRVSYSLATVFPKNPCLIQLPRCTLPKFCPSALLPILASFVVLSASGTRTVHRSSALVCTRPTAVRPCPTVILRLPRLATPLLLTRLPNQVTLNWPPPSPHSIDWLKSTRLCFRTSTEIRFQSWGSFSPFSVSA